MWEPQAISIKNLMTYEDEVFEMAPGAIMIQGLNHDKQNQKNNGAGKSVVLEAFWIAVDGSTLRQAGTTPKDLIRNGEKSAEVAVQFENRITKDSMTVTRVVKNSGSTLEVLINGDEPERDLPKINDRRDFIFETLGITREDMLSFFILTQNKYKSFFLKSDSEKKDIIGRFIEAGVVDGMIEAVGDENDGFDAKVKRKEAEIERKKGVIEGLNASLESKSKKALEERRQRKLEELDERRSALEDSIKNVDGYISTMDARITKLEDKLTEVKDTTESEADLEDARKEKEAITEKVYSLKDTQSEMVTMRRSLQAALDNTAVCPKCSHEFSLQSEDPIEEIQPMIDEITDTVNSITEKIASLDETKDDIVDLISEIRTEISQESVKSKGINNEIDSNTKQKNQYVIQKESIERRVTALDEEIDLVKTTEVDGIEDEVKKSISGETKELRILEKELMDIREKALENSQWGDRLMKFKSSLINGSLDVLNSVINKILEDMGSDITIVIDGFKELKSGELRENISVKVLSDGEILGSYGQMSFGEKARIDVATTVAFQNMINESAGEGKGVDMLWMDEVLNSLDSSGLESITPALDNLNKYVILISHATFNSDYQNVVYAVRENGVTNLKSKADVEV